MQKTSVPIKTGMRPRLCTEGLLMVDAAYKSFDALPYTILSN